MRKNYIGESPGTVAVAVSLMAFAPTQAWFAVALAVWLFCLFFFRGATVDSPQSPLTAICPCDGRILAMRDEGPNVRISIGMTLFDRHVQIAPMRGHVMASRYKTGQFNPIFVGKKTHLNERRETDIVTEVGIITIVQIAGMLARRIVIFVEPGDAVRQGEPIGLIKFSSQVDLIIPGTADQLWVAVGDRVRVGQSVATWANGSRP